LKFSPHTHHKPPTTTHTHTKTQNRLFERYAHIFLALQLFVLLNTCLLICYNPRDSLEELLAKTGILVHHPLPPSPHNPNHHNANRRSARRGGSRFSPRQEHGGVASPTAYRSEGAHNNTPRTYPVYGGSHTHNSNNGAVRRTSPPPPAATPVAVAYPLDPSHPHSMV
jgi:hypothetical protein